MTKIKQWVLTFKCMNEQRYSILMYLVMGGVTTIINIVTFWLCYSVLGIGYSVATVIAWFLSVLFAYLSNKFYVFESTNMNVSTLVHEMITFFGFRMISLLIDLFIMYICVSLFNVNALVAKVLANIVVLIVNYVFSKWVIFKK